MADQDRTVQLRAELLRRELESRATQATAAPGPEQASAVGAPSVSKAESFGRGAEQGATLGYSDEIAGGIAAAATKDPGFLGGLLALSPIGSTIYSLIKKSRPELLGDYRQARDAERAKNAEAEKANPGWYLGGELTGGAATALVPGMGATTGAKALLGGAAYGAAAGLGGSQADLTKGQGAQAAKDTFIGGALGAGAAGVGYGATKAAGWVAKKAVKAGQSLLGAAGVDSAQRAAETSAAQDAAASVAQRLNEPAGIGHEASKATFYQRSQQLQDMVRQQTKQPFILRPSQALGDREAALAESKAAQWPGTMNAAQAAESQQHKTMARFLDGLVNKIAADPKMLDNAKVGDQVGRLTSRYFDDLVAARSAFSAPVYDAARNSGASVPLAPIQEAVNSVIQENRWGPPIAAKMQGILGDISKSGRPTIADVQSLRSFLGNVAYGKKALFSTSDMSIGQQAQIARRVLGGIDDALDQAVSEGVPGAASLQKANDIWRQYTQAIEETGTRTVRKVLGLADSDGPDKIVPSLLSASPSQVRTVFRVLGDSEPEVAQNLRAQMLESKLVQGGKPPRGGSLADVELQPGNALRLLKNAEPQLRAAFEGDTKAQSALGLSFELLRRLSFGPNLRGSQTAPLVAEAMTEAGAQRAAGSIGGITGAAASAAAGVATRLLKSGRTLAKVYTTPEGIDVFNSALKAAIASTNGKTPSAASLASIESRALALGLLEPPQSQEQQSTHPSPVFAQGTTP